jgi:hypothetical protein
MNMTDTHPHSFRPTLAVPCAADAVETLDAPYAGGPSPASVAHQTNEEQ